MAATNSNSRKNDVYLTWCVSATCGQNGVSGMEQLVAAAAYYQVAIGSANAHALS
jgi:hypothetical protein